MNLTNKMCIVTGGNSGIGKETVRSFAEQGAHVVMICRNPKRARKAQKELIADTGNHQIDIVHADLGVQNEIRSAASKIKENAHQVDVLVNNAGMISHKYKETADGIERTLAVNHLGPFLLTNLLLDQLQAAPQARVVNVSSTVHRLGARVFDINNLQLKNNYSSTKAYGLSKFCNILFTHELSKRLNNSSVTANCLHPGVVGTQLSEEAGWGYKLFYTLGKPFMKTPKQGAATTIYLACSKEVASVSGKYFSNKKEVKPATGAYDNKKTKQLWHKSEELTGLT